MKGETYNITCTVECKKSKLKDESWVSFNNIKTITYNGHTYSTDYIKNIGEQVYTIIVKKLKDSTNKTIKTITLEKSDFPEEWNLKVGKTPSTSPFKPVADNSLYEQIDSNSF